MKPLVAVLERTRKKHIDFTELTLFKSGDMGEANTNIDSKIVFKNPMITRGISPLIVFQL